VTRRLLLPIATLICSPAKLHHDAILARLADMVAQRQSNEHASARDFAEIAGLQLAIATIERLSVP
jgi:hypothetical protein